ncbi:Integrase [Thalassobaculum litoreum DSM 18839]|uniref:Integrase n=2 Tax=Thalassobaculum TaxID=526215 RepID=A0A8G2BE58_9PROT|nr:Integrase [Thalassobaculum litoreum DSM 18839]
MVVPSFKEAALSVHAEYKHSWRNEKHASQWLNTLEQYAFPMIGDRAINTIESPDVIRVLSPIWLVKSETARRVRQRIGTVIDWAKAAGFRDGENPVSGATKGLPKQPDRKRHFKALAYADVPAFVEQLRSDGDHSASALAFEFMILTATRTNEVLGATWGEIDLDQSVWVIAASRMKANREHRVPLPARCLEILRAAKELGADSPYVFPGSKPKKPLSNMVFLMALRRMKVEATAHGFRSAFRDWSAEKTNFARDVCEMALAHTINDKVEAAYRRGDLFEKRRELMNAWAGYLGPSDAKVVPMRA